MGTYVVGDIHGCYDEWIELKNSIEEQDSEASFVLVGDIVDRGPKVMEMINWAVENITKNGKYQMICGNHELEKIWWFEDFLEYCDRYSVKDKDYSLWTSDGYDFQRTLVCNNIPLEQVQEIVQFFERLPLFKEMYINTGKRRGKQHYVIVHAYLPSDCINKDRSVKKRALTYPRNCTDTGRMTKVKERQSEMVWARNYCGYSWLDSTIVLHGHTPTITDNIFDMCAEKGRICYQKNDINLDCGLVFRREESNLAAIRLEDLQEFYLYPVKEKPKEKYAQRSREVQKRIREEHLNLIRGRKNK